MEVAEHSFHQGKVFTFNLSAPFLSEMYKKELEILSAFVDIMFGNESVSIGTHMYLSYR